MNSPLPILAVLACLALPPSLSAQREALGEQAVPVDDPLEARFGLVMPSASEEAWRAVGWRTNLMEAREVAQQQQRPIFLWIMVGNPHGCT
jgi:hypothetical protein